MDDGPNRWRGRLLNAALAGGALLLALLLYGLVGNALSSRTEPAGEAARAAAPADIVQVEVRNASGVPGAARRVTLYLRQHGFDVVEVNNATASGSPSAVIDRVGNADAARRVASALGLPEDRITKELMPALMLDVSVVIGSDHGELKPFGKE